MVTRFRRRRVPSTFHMARGPQPGAGTVPERPSSREKPESGGEEGSTFLPKSEFC